MGGGASKPPVPSDFTIASESNAVPDITPPRAVPPTENLKLQAMENEARARIKKLQDENNALKQQVTNVTGLRLELSQVQRALETEMLSHEEVRKSKIELEQALQETKEVMLYNDMIVF